MKLKLAIFAFATVAILTPQTPLSQVRVGPVDHPWVFLNNAGHLQLRNQNAKLILDVSKTGEMTFGEGVTPSAAAKEFAQALHDLDGVCGKPE